MQALEFIRERNTLAPVKGPQHRQLKSFVGQWTIEGENGVGEAKTPVHGEETYEWLDGGFFLLHKFNRHIGARNSTGLGWISYDSKTKTYFSCTISNSGFLRIYEVEISDHQMIISGETERATIKLSPDCEVLHIYWDECRDGTNWHSLYNMKGFRQTCEFAE